MKSITIIHQVVKNYYSIGKNLLIFLGINLIPQLAIAATSILSPSSGVLANKDLQKLLTNIRDLFPAISSLVLAFSFLAGIFYMFKGVNGLHNFGQQMQSMNRESFKDPIVKILIGTMLIYMPSTTKVFSNTLFGTLSNNIFANNSGEEANVIILRQSTNGADKVVAVSNVMNFDENGGQTLLNYIKLGAGAEWVDLINTVIVFIQLVGFVAFVRGWFIIASSTGTGAQPGSFSKGLIHLIGGIISINFVPFMKALADLAF